MSNEKEKEVEAAASAEEDDEYVLQLPRPLNIEEKKYLLAVERGDLANVRRILQISAKPGKVIMSRLFPNSYTALTFF